MNSLPVGIFGKTKNVTDVNVDLITYVVAVGERPYKCMMCTKAFNQKGALQIHVMKHTGDRPYQCEFCPSAFSQRGNLRAHIQVLVWTLLARITFS